MKNINIYNQIKRNSFSLVLLIFVSFFISCQTTTEPVDQKADIKINVKVFDQKYEPINNADIQYAQIVSGGPVNYLGGFDLKFSGYYEKVIPAEVMKPNVLTNVRVSPPNDPDFAGELPILFENMILCSDTTLLAQFIRKVRISCNDFCDDQLNLFINLDDESKSIRSSCTKYYSNSSSFPMSITMDVSSLPSTVSYELYVNNVKAPGNSATVQPNQEFWVCFYYNTSTPQTKTTNAVTISRTVNGTSCRVCNLTVSNEAVINEKCECPSFAAINHPALTGTYEVICLGDLSRRIDVDLSSVRNNSSDCDLIFTPVRFPADDNFNHPSLKILEFSGANGSNTEFVLSPGDKLSNMLVQFSATSQGTFTAEAFYKVQTRTKDGVLKDCPNQLIVKFNGSVSQGICVIYTEDLLHPNNLFKTNQPNTETIQTLQQCPNLDIEANARYIYIGNEDSRCSLNVDVEFLTNPDGVFYLDGNSNGNSYTIPPLTTIKVRVAFIPTSDKIFPNGRCNNPKLDFNASFRIKTFGTDKNAPICNSTYQLTGKVVQDNCSSGEKISLEQWGFVIGTSPGLKIKTGMRLEKFGKYLALVKIPDLDTKDYAIYSDAIDVTNQTATLAVGGFTVEFNKIGQFSKTNGTDLCDDKSICNNLNRATGWTNSVNLVPFDLVAVRLQWSGEPGYSYGFLYVTEIRWAIDNRDPSGRVPQIQFEICNPYMY